jgi:ribosomal protein S1
MSQQQNQEKSGRNPKQGNPQGNRLQRQQQQSSGPRVLVQTGQIVDGIVTGFTSNERDSSKREGILIRLSNGERAFMRLNQVGSAHPESRIQHLRVGDKVRVEVTVVEEKRRRRVKGSERLLFFEEVAAKLAGGLHKVSGVCINKTRAGAFVQITTPGAAFNMVGLLHASNMEEPADMGRIQVNQPMTVDILSARVDREKRVLRLSLGSHSERRHELEDRFPVGVELHARIVAEGKDSYELQLKGKEACVLPKTELADLDPETLVPGVSIKLYVTGVDANGAIVLSRSMPL